jgi:hypothetical protein
MQLLDEIANGDTHLIWNCDREAVRAILAERQEHVIAMESVLRWFGDGNESHSTIRKVRELVTRANGGTP